MADSFEAIAQYYDAMYVDEQEYRRECAQVCGLIEKYHAADGGELLDIACGTGAQSLFLCERFHVTGLDVSESMLQAARRKVPGAVFLRGDMTDFYFEEKFNAAVNLFGSIGFAKNREQMERSLRCTYNCLLPGGVFILTPWETKETFREEIITASGERQGVSYCRMEHVRRTGENGAYVEMYHLIGKDGKVRQVRTGQKIALWSEEEYIRALLSAGFTIRERLTEEQFRMGAFLCTK